MPEQYGNLLTAITLLVAAALIGPSGIPSHEHSGMSPRMLKVMMADMETQHDAMRLFFGAGQEGPDMNASGKENGNGLHKGN